ncbi:hypothetical protein WA158_007561 [Blastocystis sp. Blastoise]
MFLLIGFIPYRNLALWMYGKSRSTGRMFFLNIILMFPFMIVFTLFVRIKHLTKEKEENPYDKILDTLYVGRYPFYKSLWCPQCKGEIDICCELPRPTFIKVDHYLYIPALDALVPSTFDLIKGAELAITWNCPLYVHCMNGHGRSVVFCLVYMVLTGKSNTILEAYQYIKKIRPRVGVLPFVLQRIQRDLDLYLEKKKKNEI